MPLDAVGLLDAPNSVVNDLRMLTFCSSLSNGLPLQSVLGPGLSVKSETWRQVADLFEPNRLATVGPMKQRLALEPNLSRRDYKSLCKSMRLAAAIHG